MDYKDQIWEDLMEFKLDLQKGYIRNKMKAKYEEMDTEILKLKKQLLLSERRYNQLHRRLSLSRTVLDVGRSVLSALKEEIRAWEK